MHQLCKKGKAKMNYPFLISATVDFPDDCQRIVFTEELLDRLLKSLQWIGVRRVYWNYYPAGMWSLFAGSSSGVSHSLQNLEEPMAAACRLAHRRGLEFYAVLKPYEAGGSHSIPLQEALAAGKPGLPRIGGVCTGIDPWILERPEMRVRGRCGDIPAGLQTIPVQRIQLRQRDMAPIRIDRGNLEIWTSADNNGYQKKDVDFTVSEEVQTCPRDIYDARGLPVTRRGDATRVLNLTGLNLLDPFIAITTNFEGDTGAFCNTAVEMVRAFGPGDLALPIVVASHKAVWDRPRDLRTGGLEYDAGHDFNVCLDTCNRGSNCVHCQEKGVTECLHAGIYPDTVLCSDGVIAFARGRNEYLSASPCEAYPDVRDYWLSWVSECITAGVDGVDVRISNHSCWTDMQDLYGFNEPILTEYERRYGVNPDTAPYDPDLLGTLRGEFYNQFLRAAKRRLAAAGKRLQAYIEVESFRSAGGVQARRVTRPGHITFDWRNWMRSGLLDEATFMTAIWTPEEALADPLGQEVVKLASECGIPLHLRYYMAISRDGRFHADLLEDLYRFEGLAGYNLYEAASLYDTQQLGPDGQLAFYPGMTEALHGRIRHLGIVP